MTQQQFGHELAKSPLYEIQIDALSLEYNLNSGEKDVLRFLGTGMSNEEIGKILGISGQQTANKTTYIFRKMNRYARAEVIGVILERMTKQCEAFVESLERVKTMRGESFNNIEMEIHHTLAKSFITPNLVRI